MSLKRQTLWSLFPLVTLTVVNLISVPLFYRYLGAELYALWFYVQTLGTSFGFIDFGMGVSVGRYIGVALGKEDHTAVREYWATGNMTAIPFLFVMSGVFTGVGIYFGPRWFNVAAANVPLLKWCFLAGGVSLFLSYYLMFWNVLSQTHLDFRFISIVRVCATLLQVPPAILLAKLTRNPFVLIVWMTGIGAIELLVFILHARRSYDVRLDPRLASLARLREMGAYTGKSFGTILISSVFGSIDRLIAGRVASPLDFASYTIAGNLGGRLSALSYASAAPVFSNTTRSEGEVNRPRPAHIYDETFEFLIGWYALAALAVCVWGMPLAKFWLGPLAGERVAPFLPPLILGYSFSAISIISSAQLGALNRVGTQAIFGLILAAVTIPALYIGWRLGGVVGLAWGFLASRAVLFAQDLYLIRLIGAGGWLAWPTWRLIGWQVLVAVSFWLVRNYLPPSLITSLALAALHCTFVASLLLRPVWRHFLAGWR